MSNRRGVIFDMDGVLIDSYRAHFESWKAMLAERGETMTREQFDATFGRTSREVIASLWPEKELSDEEIAAMDHRKEALFREIVARDFPAMPGAVELLSSLHASGFLLAVGSSGPPENVFEALDRLGNRWLFDAVITGADVTRGKPDPQVFRLAADRLGLTPRQCVVVEDAPLGVQAAHAAGMSCVGLTSTGRTPEMLADADLVVGSLQELSPETFAALLAKPA